MDANELHGPNGPFEALSRACEDSIASDGRFRAQSIGFEVDASLQAKMLLRQIEKEWPSLFDKAALMAVGPLPFGRGEWHNLAESLDFFGKAPRTCDVRVNGAGTGLRVAVANKKLQARRFRALLVLLPIEEETP